MSAEIPFIRRSAAFRVAELLSTFRVIIVEGARQTGKTTLVEHLLTTRPRTFSLDDEAVRQRALNDPVGFVDAIPDGACIDEYQRAGEPLMLAIKRRVDTRRGRGQLILTGSASYSATRHATETLAGRAGRLVLWPLSIGERRGVRETFLDDLFRASDWSAVFDETTTRDHYLTLLLEGGYPEVVTEGMGDRARRLWFDSYVRDVLSREALRPLADVRLERELARLVRLLAARSSQLLVGADLARDADLNRATVASYLALIEALHLFTPLPAWATSATTRAKRHPKIHFVDTGLAAHLARVGSGELHPVTGQMTGPLLESFVVAELHKQRTWCDTDIQLSHFQDRNGAEIDVIVENLETGQVAGIEVKATATPTARDARHLAYVRDRLGARFALGLVLHLGQQSLSLGDRLFAVPASTLWHRASK